MLFYFFFITYPLHNFSYDNHHPNFRTIYIVFLFEFLPSIIFTEVKNRRVKKIQGEVYILSFWNEYL